MTPKIASGNTTNSFDLSPITRHYNLTIKSNQNIIHHQTPRIQKSGIGVRGI